MRWFDRRVHTARRCPHDRPTARRRLAHPTRGRAARLDGARRRRRQARLGHGPAARRQLRLAPAGSATARPTTRSCSSVSPARRTTTPSSATPGRTRRRRSRRCSRPGRRATGQATRRRTGCRRCYVNGQAVMPTNAQIYYRRRTNRHVEAFPPGFRMIAGDAKATRPAAAGHLLELRRRRRRAALEHRSDVPRHAPECAAPARHVPELLGRQEPRQREPPEPRRLPDAGPLPARSSPTRCRRSR